VQAPLPFAVCSIDVNPRESFLGPRGPLIEPSMPVPQEKSRSPLQPYKSSQDHCQPIKIEKGKRRKGEKEKKRNREKEK